MKRYAILTYTHRERELVNCWSCKYKDPVPGRHLPLCRLGMQRDCIEDNYDKWEYEDDWMECVTVSGFEEVEE